MDFELVMPALPVVMVVDIDDEARKITAENLENAGYQVVACRSRDEALASFSDAVDAVILPVELGDDDGPSLTRELKDRVGELAYLPVMVSGDPVARVRAFEAGCDEFLEGDTSFFELDARIRSLLTHRWHYQALGDALRRLLEAQHKKRELAALVVHDLRNPLSALQGNLDYLYEELAADTRVASVLGDSKEVCRKALSMVASILDVEELEAGLLLAEPTKVKVAALLADSSKHHAVPIEVRRLNLKVDADADLEAALDVDLVARVIENLLDNAVRYAPVEGQVVLRAFTDGDDLVLQVGNDGPPVPEADRVKIFDRFYRIEARRAGARQNRGLGLYFCLLVAEAHAGSIAVEELEDLPACFTLRIPQRVASEGAAD
jgi:signal transduction histidine kinase